MLRVDHRSPSYIKCVCTETLCPAYSKCCFLPTEVYPDKHGTVHILFVGQGGSKDERKKQIPFIGRAGERIRQQIVSARKRIGYFGVAFSNTIRDNPYKSRTPERAELDCCLEHLYQDICHLKKKYGLRVVMPLGTSSMHALIPECSLAGIGAMRGKLFYVRNPIYGTVAMMPTYHPAAMLYNGTHFSEKYMDSKDATVVDDIIAAYNSPAFDREVDIHELIWQVKNE